MSVSQLNATTNYGIVDTSTHSGRKKYDYNDNETPSYVPNYFLDKAKRKNSVDESFRNIQETDDSVELIKIANAIKDDIKNHVEMRLQIFCLQLALVYKTEQVFHIHGTKAQVGLKTKSSPTKDPNKEPANVSAPSYLVEAHSSTLPNLKFISSGSLSDVNFNVFNFQENEWTLGTSFYKIWNTTHKLPRFVNDIDSLIDTNIKIPFFKHFRHYCVQIINDTSKGREIGVGFHQFLCNLKAVIDKAWFDCGLDYSFEVLDWYKEVVQCYLDNPAEKLKKILGFSIVNTETVCLSKIQKKLEIEIQIANIMSIFEKKCADKNESKEIIKCAITTISGLSPTSELILKYIKPVDPGLFHQILIDI